MDRARGETAPHHRQSVAAGRFRLPALAGIELPAGPTTSTSRPTRSANSAAHRRHGRRPDPRAQGWRALFRADQGQHDQFRGSRCGPPQGQLRQSDAALSDERCDGTLDPDDQGQVGRVIDIVAPHRQGPARADRRAAAHRQDGAAAEHRQGDHRQPPEVLPDRAADRRAPRGSHRHAAHGEGRGRLLDLRRTGHAPRRRSPKW
jgi:hypothetical protein